MFIALLKCLHNKISRSSTRKPSSSRRFGSSLERETKMPVSWYCLVYITFKRRPSDICITEDHAILNSIVQAPSCTQGFRRVLLPLATPKRPVYDRCKPFFSLCVGRILLQRQERTFASLFVTRLTALQWPMDDETKEVLQGCTEDRDLGPFFVFWASTTAFVKYRRCRVAFFRYTLHSRKWQHRALLYDIKISYVHLVCSS